MIIPYLFLLFYLNISSSISTKFTSDLNLFFDKCKNLKNDKICDVKSILHKNGICYYYLNIKQIHFDKLIFEIKL